ncbi:MAG: sulfite exporter TauE/SafE family protein [Oscillospiraceae bacterium]
MRNRRRGNYEAGVRCHGCHERIGYQFLVGLRGAGNVGCFHRNLSEKSRFECEFAEDAADGSRRRYRGVAGKILFQQIKAGAPSENFVGFVQAVVLMIITLITLIYTIYKSKIKTLQLQSSVISTCVGLVLGIFSSFLGIGGGPINLMVLSFCFSMGIKEAAVNSLFIILISQIFSLGQTVLTGSIPDMKLGFLVVMILGGILGGKVGGRVNKKIKEKHVNWLFEGLMLVIIVINIYNAYRFS